MTLNNQNHHNEQTITANRTFMIGSCLIVDTFTKTETKTHTKSTITNHYNLRRQLPLPTPRPTRATTTKTKTKTKTTALTTATSPIHKNSSHTTRSLLRLVLSNQLKRNLHLIVPTIIIFLLSSLPFFGVVSGVIGFSHSTTTISIALLSHRTNKNRIAWANHNKNLKNDNNNYCWSQIKQKSTSSRSLNCKNINNINNKNNKNSYHYSTPPSTTGSMFRMKDISVIRTANRLQRQPRFQATLFLSSSTSTLLLASDTTICNCRSLRHHHHHSSISNDYDWSLSSSCRHLRSSSSSSFYIPFQKGRHQYMFPYVQHTATVPSRSNINSIKSTSRLFFSTQPIAVEEVDHHHDIDEESELIPPLRYNNDRINDGANSNDSLLTNINDENSNLSFHGIKEAEKEIIARINVHDNQTLNNIDKKDDHDSTQPNKDEIVTILESKGIRSRPVDGGNWNVVEPLKWTVDFGRRSKYYEATILKDLICLHPGDEGYHDVSGTKVEEVTIVRTKEQAKIVLEKLFQSDQSVLHACDTEVMDIDLSSVGPVGNGYVTCLSMYSGPDFDYGLGDGPGTSLWIDNLDEACGILQEFKDWFENDKFLKVWHNYGFDRHVMWNEGIDVKGFGGDTMHMARLLDTSREKGYSLEALTTDLLGKRKTPMKEIFGVPRRRKDGSDGSLIDLPPVEVLQRDPKYRRRWIMYSCYDAQGTWEIREKLEDLLKNQEWNGNDNLFRYYWEHMRPFGEVLTDMERRGVRVDADNYLANVEIQAREDREHHLQVFRKWAATKIGPDGLALNVASALQMRIFLFGGAVNEKTKEQLEQVRVFKVPRDEIPEDALAEYRRIKDESIAKNTKSTEIQPKDLLEGLEKMKAAQLKDICDELKLKKTGKKSELQDRIREHYRMLAEAGEENHSAESSSDNLDSMSKEDLMHAARARNLPVSGTKKDIIQRIRDDIEAVQELNDLTHASTRTSSERYIELSKILAGGPIADMMAALREKENEEPKHVDVTIRGLALKPEKYTAGGMPSVTSDVLRKLAGNPFSDPPKYGTAYETLGEEGCKALFSLCAIGSIDTMITNFLTSLQELADEQSRVHCSLNLNTETGRLSSRRPNLQNQPALEKDKYKIRKAFQSSPGNNLIVADYGQLELRLLASLTECESMINAFAAGGDFHSRTAIDMFPYVKAAVDQGECLLEWDYSKGDPPKPLLKDQFASERRKAKTLNFSIAYGKTAHGLSKDWGVSKNEAEEMLQAWYDARKEVREWQEETKEKARNSGITRTLMGRYRQLPGAMGYDRKLAEHALRASINTPIQGGAADIAMMAMNKINANQKLKDLGWILLLQIHDEVMLEGPEETAEEAFDVVLQCMKEPWVYGLKPTSVPLTVDGSCNHKNWYDAK